MQDSYRCSTKAGAHNQPIVPAIPSNQFCISIKPLCISIQLILYLDQTYLYFYLLIKLILYFYQTPFHAHL